MTSERWLAISFAVLMVTSLVAMPALAGGSVPSSTDEHYPAQYASGPAPEPGQGGDGPPGSGHDDGTSGPRGHERGSEATNVTPPELAENSSLETVLVATKRLEELEWDEKASEPDAINETVEAVNESIGAYRHVDHVDDADAFDSLRDAQTGLAQLQTEFEENQSLLEATSADLYDAANASARLGVRDAAFTVEQYEAEFRNPGQRQSAESHLGNALDALERADDTLEGDDIDDRTQALEHLETAWTHAQKALDTVEANTDPDLSLSQGHAFEDDGTIIVSVSIRVADVRSYNYDEATVTVETADGETRTEQVSLYAPESSGAAATGMTTVDVGEDAENATVTVTATATHDDDRSVEETLEIVVDEADVIPDLPDPDEYAEVELEDDDSGVVVEAGGDGLHETHLAVTDETPETDDEYRAGPMVRIENETAIDEATVTIPVDDDLEREGNLSVVTWDPHSEEPWKPVETEIDREAGTATAEVEHFSFFSVFWIDEWEDHTSDTITLDDDQTDGDAGNGSETETADFVFVIDESGSMSGSPIHYAELAAKRFVGALTEDERAALVGYASGASLDQPLTSDHDAVNSSLEGLSAGGGTDTEAGLRAGLGHLQSDGWENRSDVMILLSDGKSNSGSYPTRVAEDAADAGVEISTVGLGNSIDENELREIAAITGGDFYHVEREEDLPDTFERVAENQTGVELNDTNGDGIPDLVAEMDLAMPTGEPGVVGEPLELDPIALDTSGDGILDNETVDIDYRVFEEDNETKLHASVTYAEHHPARIDTTGDGLTDAEQLEGWEIEVIHTDANAQKANEILENPDDSRDISSVFTTRNVSADPLVSDTDGDGLTDVEELEIGTDPETQWTVADGYTDAEALDDLDEDPTVYSTSPPDIYLQKFESGWTRGGCKEGRLLWDCDYERPGYKYTIELLVEDHYHGVSYVELRQSGVTELEEEYADTPSVEPKAEFYAEAEEFLSWLRGAETTVTAKDAHGNERIETVATKRSIGGKLATEAPLMDQRDLGALSGLTHGTSEFPDFVRLLLNEPEEMGEAIFLFTKEYNEVQEDPHKSETIFWIQVVRNMGADVHRTQMQDNPEDSPTGSAVDDAEYCLTQYADDDQSPSAYCEFAAGWYQGYTTYLAIEMSAGSKGTLKGVSSVRGFRRVLDDVGDNIDTVRPLRWIDHPETTPGRITHRIVTDGGSPHVDAPAVARHLREDHGIDTAGGIERAFDHLDGDLRHLEDLSSSEQAALAARLSKSSDPSAARAFVDELDDVGDVRFFLNQDRATQHKSIYLHRNKESLRLVDDSVTAQDILYVQENGDLLETQLIAKRGDDAESVRWMELGDADAGMTHINGRHISGSIGIDEKFTSFFPVGQTVKGRQLPASTNQQEIYDLVKNTVKREDPQSGPGDTLIYKSEPPSHTGISELRVEVEQGQIITAIPEDGGAVKQWNPNLNNGQGGWLDER